MLHGLMLTALAIAATSSSNQAFQSKNGEFIFSKYPPRALAAGEQGAVRFRAEVDARGNVMACEVTATSGHKRLDQETCDLIVNHATFKPAFDSDGKARAAVHDGLVNWRIPGGVARASKTASGRSPDQIVCKRQAKTGSLVSNSRLCMTRREWGAYADRNQDDWGSLQGRQGTGACPIDPETKQPLC